MPSRCCPGPFCPLPRPPRTSTDHNMPACSQRTSTDHDILNRSCSGSQSKANEEDNKSLDKENEAEPGEKEIKDFVIIGTFVMGADNSIQNYFLGGGWFNGETSKNIFFQSKHLCTGGANSYQKTKTYKIKISPLAIFISKYGLTL